MRVKFMMLILMTSVLSACSITTVAPAEQVRKQVVETSQKAEKSTRTVVKKQLVSEYRCDKSQVISVQSTPTANKNSTITLTYNQSSHKLSPNVTKKGKKYSNIRWIWAVDNLGIGTLVDNRNRILARNCIKR